MFPVHISRLVKLVNLFGDLFDKGTEAPRNREKPPGLEGGGKRQLERLSEISDWITT